MPRYLTEQDIADFRAELCKVATERFARHGYEGVTMRQLAEALGCSPKTPPRAPRAGAGRAPPRPSPRHGYEGVTMRQLAEALGCSPKTPYRYFKDKADILATVRGQAFAKFADAPEAALVDAPDDPAVRAQRTAEPYFRFAMKNPHAHRIMFD